MVINLCHELFFNVTLTIAMLDMPDVTLCLTDGIISHFHCQCIIISLSLSLSLSLCVSLSLLFFPSLSPFLRTVNVCQLTCVRQFPSLQSTVKRTRKTRRKREGEKAVHSHQATATTTAFNYR